MPENLNDYASTCYSQNGEDGILEEILRRLDITEGTCVEFGAGDGRDISNTYRLWHDLGWDALLIEAVAEKFNALSHCVTRNRGTVLAMNAFVTHDGPKLNSDTLPGGNTLDALMEQVEKASTLSFQDVDVLSIDIDGNDYHVWKAFKNYTAKCVIIEHRAEIPPHISYHDPPGREWGIGASARALEELATEKGYTLVALTETNTFFIRDDLAPKLGDVVTRLEDMHDPSWCTYMIGEFSGRRCHLTRPHPQGYYPLKDPEERKLRPERQLYPVQFHEADWNTLQGKFRIQDDKLHVHVQEDNPYVGTAPLYSLSLDLKKEWRNACDRAGFSLESPE